MNHSTPIVNQEDRNIIAALLSILPGLGHLYKHHYLSGFGLLIGGNILVGFVSILMTLSTFGFSLFALPFYIVAVAGAAYALPDWHGHHHFLHPWTPEEAPAPTDEPPN